jgi:two-component system, NtrC family, C4-dicarboxylate transport sensor histidine kinase DctB
MHEWARIMGRDKMRQMWILAAIIIVLVVVWQVYILSERVALTNLRENGENRLSLYSSTLRSALGKYWYLPVILSRNGLIIDALLKNDNTETANKELEIINAAAGSDVLYILAIDGSTVLSSNWRSKNSFVGKNYAFRPYFRDAIDKGRGSFFAIGVTTGEPGYFIANSIKFAGKVIGVAVAKVKLESLQETWRNAKETIFVTDTNDVVFLSSRKSWKYKSLKPLTPEAIRKIEAGRQYDRIVLQQLPIIQTGMHKTDQISIEGEQFYIQHRNLPFLKWKIYYLSPLRTVHDKIMNVVILAAGLAVILITVLMYYRERRLKKRNSRMAQEADVFKVLNKKLKEEVSRHQRTEKQLHATQEEIVQAKKLAAMGQMSTAIAHELNQPITAIRTTTASVCKLLELQKLGEVKQGLATINDLAVRLTRLTAQLKTFARKNKGPAELVDVAQSFRNALELFKPRITKLGVDLNVAFDKNPPAIVADPLKIEQVFVNLIGNALDAMANCEEKKLSISLTAHGNFLRIVLTDTGQGIYEENLSSLFDPFFTTKPYGTGMGLGLSIVYGIISELNGKISASNNKDAAGASVHIELPLKRTRPDFSFREKNDN